MRRRWLAPLLSTLASATFAGPQQATVDVAARLDAAAQQQLRLDAQALRGQLGLNVESDCLAHLRTAQDPAACWRDVSSTVLGWRGAAGLSEAGGSVTLHRPNEDRSCLPLAEFAAALPRPPQRLQQMTGLGHRVVDGLEAVLPVYQPRLTWRYVSASVDRMTQLWVDVDDRGCVSQISLLIDGPVPIER